MGDFRIISGVTQALAFSVQRAISSASSPVSHALVTTTRPDKQEQTDSPRVNVYLFHVQPSAALRNIDLPTMMGDRSISQPTLALDLYYLFSFYGSNNRSKLESQLLMGLTMGALHARPFIEPSELDSILGDGAAYHEVALSVETMSIHELSRLWQTFPQVPLVLSTAYRATTVLISEDVDLDPAQPVINRDFAISPGQIQYDVPPLMPSVEPEKPPARFRFSDKFWENPFRRRE